MGGMGSFLGQGLICSVLESPEAYSQGGPRGAPRMICCLESYLVCRLWVGAVSSSSSGIGCNGHKDNAGKVRPKPLRQSSRGVGRGGKCSGETQEPPLLESPKASVPLPGTTLSGARETTVTPLPAVATRKQGPPAPGVVREAPAPAQAAHPCPHLAPTSWQRGSLPF